MIKFVEGIIKNTLQMGKTVLKTVSNLFKAILALLAEFGKGASYAMKH